MFNNRNILDTLQRLTVFASYTALLIKNSQCAEVKPVLPLCPKLVILLTSELGTSQYNGYIITHYMANFQSNQMLFKDERKRHDLKEIIWTRRDSRILALSSWTAFVLDFRHWWIKHECFNLSKLTTESESKTSKLV